MLGIEYSLQDVSKRGDQTMRSLMILWVLPTLNTAANADGGVPVARDGNSEYVICIPAGATPVDQRFDRKCSSMGPEIAWSAPPLLSWTATLK